MKLKKILFALMFFTSLNLEAQTSNVDLEVDKVCTVVFDSKINFHNASLREDIVVFKIIENKMMLSIRRSFTSLTINVELSNGDFYSISCHPAYSNGATFLDMRTRENGSQAISSESMMGDKRSVEENKVLSQEALNRVNDNVKSLLVDKKLGSKNYLDLNYRSGGIKAYLSNIYSDKDHIYFNVEVKNSSGVIYEQDYTTIYYENKRGLGGGDYSNKQAYNIDVFPTYSSFEDNGILNPGQTRTISMAIPIFAISNNSRFRVIVFEKNGFRNITFSIKGKKLNRILKRSRI